MTPVRIVSMSCADDLVSFVLQRANGPRFAVGPTGQTVLAEGEPVGESGQALERAFPRGLPGMLVEIAVNDLLIFGRLVEGVGRRVHAEKTLPPRRAVGPLTQEEPWSA